MTINSNMSAEELQVAYNEALAALRAAEVARQECELRVENIETYAFLTGVKLTRQRSQAAETVG